MQHGPTCLQNGPEGQSIHGYHGQQAGDNPGSTNGLRGRKRDLTEGGIREPGLLEWPRMIKKNLVTDFPAATFDYKPTVLEILGVEAPTGWPLDGTSLVPLIKGEVPSSAQREPRTLLSLLRYTTLLKHGLRYRGLPYDSSVARID